MRTPSLVVLAATLGASVAMADEPLDVTIRVVESPSDLPSAVTKTIELPPAASATARERAQPGLDRANEARSRGRELGQSVAEEAKTRGQERERGDPP